MLFANEFFEKLWYSSHPLGLLLVPVAWCYALVIIIRRLCYQSGIFAINQIDAPGVISRGYGGHESASPQQVRPDSNPLLVGDEPVLIARNTLTPVAVAKERRLAAEELIKHYKCNLIICDDGLQHYGLGRDIEI